jgi:hypothetical protein
VTNRDLIEAKCHVWSSVACCTKGRCGCANTPPFSSGERVFIAEEILHRSPDSVLRVGSEFQAAGLIEAVHGMNQSDHPGTGQIVECDARRYRALEASRDSVHQIEVLKDCSVSGAVVRNAFGVVAEFHFRSFSARLVRGNKQRADLLPKTPRAEGDRPLAAIGERSVSGGLHETERSAVKEAWGYPSGGGRAQVGRSGRQAKRCPNMRAEWTEETTRLAVQQSVSQSLSSGSLHGVRPGAAIDPVRLTNEGF